MRSLWLLCICLLVVGSQHLVAGGRWSVVGKKALGERVTSSTPRYTQIQGQPATSHQSPTTGHLPCQDSSPTCLQTLGDIAVKNSRELAVLQKAITLQKKKLWTSWLHADGLNPMAIGLRMVRNIAGGGDRAALQLEITRLEMRHLETVTTLRQTITQAVLEYERSQQEVVATQRKLAYHLTRLQVAEIGYRLGEGQTDAMLFLWQTREELQSQATLAKDQVRKAAGRLESFIGFR